MDVCIRILCIFYILTVAEEAPHCSGASRFMYLCEARTQYEIRTKAGLVRIAGIIVCVCVFVYNSSLNIVV